MTCLRCVDQELASTYNNMFAVCRSGTGAEWAGEELGQGDLAFHSSRVVASSPPPQLAVVSSETPPGFLSQQQERADGRSVISHFSWSGWKGRHSCKTDTIFLRMQPMWNPVIHVWFHLRFPSVCPEPFKVVYMARVSVSPFWSWLFSLSMHT